jgi:hypothetical protein
VGKGGICAVKKFNASAAFAHLRRYDAGRRATLPVSLRQSPAATTVAPAAAQLLLCLCIRSGASLRHHHDEMLACQDAGDPCRHAIRVRQDGTVVAVRRVTVGDGLFDDVLFDLVRLNGIATSTDGKTIFVTVTGPLARQGGVLALPAF